MTGARHGRPVMSCCGARNLLLAVCSQDFDRCHSFLLAASAPGGARKRPRFGNPPCMSAPFRKATTIFGCRFNCCDFTTPGAASQGGKWRGSRLLGMSVFQKVSKKRRKTRFRFEPKAGFPLHETPPRRSAFLLSLFYITLSWEALIKSKCAD